MSDDEDTFSPELMSTDMLRVAEAAVHQVLHKATLPRYTNRRFERRQFDLSHLDHEQSP